MPKITFCYSIDKDAENWISRIFDKNISFIPKKELLSKYPQDLLTKIKTVGDRKKAKKLVINFLKNDTRNRKKNPIIKEELKAIKAAWKIRENAFFSIIERLLEKPIYRNDFTGYLTTFFRCPYSEKEAWFMIGFWASLPEQITIIAHELLHLQFLNQYRQVLEKNGLKEKQIQYLKESLTFLLNEKDFSEILLRPDKGYPEHAEIRKKLKQVWQKRNNFEQFLKKAMKMV